VHAQRNQKNDDGRKKHRQISRQHISFHKS
jgi:hypothetical protein